MNPDLYIPLIVGAFFISLNLYYVIPYFLESRRQKQLNRYGVKMQAVITNMQQTNVYINEQPQVKFKLKIIGTDGVTYEAVTKAVIPMIQIPQFQPGATINIMVDKNNPKNVAIARA